MYRRHRSSPDTYLRMQTKCAVWHIQNDAKHILAHPIILTTPLQVIKESSRIGEERLTPKTCKESKLSFSCDSRLLCEGNWSALDNYLTNEARASRRFISRLVHSRGLLPVI